MKPYHTDDSVTLYHGDALAVLAGMPDGCVDAVITDPPYGLGFMGRAWDRLTTDWHQAWSVECRRLLKPGGHLLAFGGSRTFHRLACAIEDAGFEIRDTISWLYGSGFPKSLDVSKAIDRAAGAERPVVAPDPQASRRNKSSWRFDDKCHAYDGAPHLPLTAPATDAARCWQGWGTALKPAWEPIVVARKPPVGTVAGNVLAYGTGALNIDACRVEGAPRTTHTDGNRRTRNHGATMDERLPVGDYPAAGSARWPTNVVLDEAAAAELDRQSGDVKAGGSKHGSHASGRRGGIMGEVVSREINFGSYADQGGASRFFPVFRYEPKATTAERPRVNGTAHPTVKPLDLIRWLARLVTPPGGLILDPFAGSGTTGEAAICEGFRATLVEREADYLPLIVARLSRPIQPVLRT